ncbi:MAG: thioredoxin domain-containing protein [Marmoricola sp.]
MSKKERETSRAARAAAVRQQQASQERRRRIIITAAVLAVLAIIVGAGVLLGGGGDDPSAGDSKVDARADGQALVLGTSPDAPKVVVYEDFLCPYCREFEAASRDTLRDAARRGDAVVEYRPFRLLPDDYSLTALTAWAAVLEGGTGAQALEFHNLLFENQPYEAATDKPGIDDLVDLAGEAGVTDDDVLAAMREPHQEFVDAADANAREAGIEGTPTVLVDGEKLTGAPSEMADQLEERLAP